MEYKKIWLVLLLLLSIFVVGEIIQFVDVGDKVETEIDKSLGTIDYIEVKDKIIAGWEEVYINESYQREKCSSELVEQEIFNITLNLTVNETEGVISCENITDYHLVLDPKLKGDQIYSYSNVKKVKYNNNSYDFNDKGCFVCEHVDLIDQDQTLYGKLLLCLSKKDGFSYGRAEGFNCVLRSGESGRVINLEDNSIVFNDIDNGVRIS